MLIAATLMAGLALLVCGLLAGYVYADVAARAAQMAFLRDQLELAKADRGAAEERVKTLVTSIQGVHNQLTTQVADLNDRMSVNAMGRAPSTNPLRTTPRAPS
jgi:hypothetical protein